MNRGRGERSRIVQELASCFRKPVHRTHTQRDSTLVGELARQLRQVEAWESDPTAQAQHCVELADCIESESPELQSTVS